MSDLIDRQAGKIVNGDICPNCGAKMDVPDNNVGEMGGEQE